MCLGAFVSFHTDAFCNTKAHGEHYGIFNLINIFLFEKVISTCLLHTSTWVVNAISSGGQIFPFVISLEVLPCPLSNDVVHDGEDEQLSNDGLFFPYFLSLIQRKYTFILFLLIF